MYNSIWIFNKKEVGRGINRWRLFSFHFECKKKNTTIISVVLLTAAPQQVSIYQIPIHIHIKYIYIIVLSCMCIYNKHNGCCLKKECVENTDYTKRILYYYCQCTYYIKGETRSKISRLDNNTYIGIIAYIGLLARQFFVLYTSYYYYYITLRDIKIYIYRIPI